MVVIRVLFRKFKLDDLPYCTLCGEVKTKNTICKKCREERDGFETNMEMKYMDIERRDRKNKQFDNTKRDRVLKRIQKRMGIEPQEVKKETDT